MGYVDLMKLVLAAMLAAVIQARTPPNRGERKHVLKGRARIMQKNLLSLKSPYIYRYPAQDPVASTGQKSQVRSAFSGDPVRVSHFGGSVADPSRAVSPSSMKTKQGLRNNNCQPFYAHRHDPIPELSKTRKSLPLCRFLGRSQGDPTSRVAVTGCPGENEVQITLVSKNRGGQYIVDRQGKVVRETNLLKGVPNCFMGEHFPFKVEEIPSPFHSGAFSTALSRSNNTDDEGDEDRGWKLFEGDEILNFRTETVAQKMSGICEAGGKRNREQKTGNREHASHFSPLRRHFLVHSSKPGKR